MESDPEAPGRISTAEESALRHALALARREHPHPNPRVGAVVLGPDGKRLGEGSHGGPGSPHAERAALDATGTVLPEGSTLVVTLEPCDHHGRTPPCTDAIVSAGLTRVVVGAPDPDARVAGRGVERLRREGVDVVASGMSAEVESADPAYFHHRRTGRPLVTLKSAITLDGQTAALDGSSRWITGPDARQDAHRLRARADAVVVGAGTLISDDPSLTVRLAEHDGYQPVGVVMAGKRALPASARLWDRPHTLAIATEDLGVPTETMIVPGDEGRPDLAEALAGLAARGHLAILVEGGASLGRSLWSAGLVDRGVTYVGGLLAGGTGVPMLAGPWNAFEDAHRISIEDVRRLGADLRIDWSPVPR